MFQITRHEQFSPMTFLWEVQAPQVARAAKPGQFIMLRLAEGGERIPLTIADFDRDGGSVTIVIQALGKTTRDMLEHYKAGDSFSDFVGPLGLQSELQELGHVVFVGGGLGVAPVFPQLRAFKEAGNRTTAIIGFRSKDLVFWEEKFRPYCDDLIVCTDDGSYGREGFVTKALDDLLRHDADIKRVIAVGPLPMMRACAEVTRPYGVETVVSLNAIMVDGTGMCGSCRVTIDGEIRFACVDGPEFDAHKVDFAELMLRQRRFRGEEGLATEDYAHVCNLEKTLFDEEKRNYKKIRDLSPEQVAMPERDPQERAENFKEVNLGYALSDALIEAERCIQCARPTCISGCPVSIDIPRFIRHLLVRDLAGALEAIQDNNLFPSVCGRVCPQESQCEAQCIIGKKVQPVAIGRLERFVGDMAPRKKVERSGGARIGKVAIVGSGPAGLACAADLARKNVDVTIYEALHVVGGVLAYGIPSFRLPRQTIAREIQGLKDMGVTIETNVVIGKTFTLQQMLQQEGFDAIFVGTGAGYPMFLNIPGEFAGGVYSANEFLTRVNLMGGDQFPYRDTPVNLGERVVVIGAGNTAMDCLRVSKRIGAKTVHCVYRRSHQEAPARAEELRHAEEEGIEFHFLRSPLEIITDGEGGVKAIRCQVMELGPADESGRRRPVPVEGQEETFDCETVIYALGTRANPIISQSAPELETQRGGYITVDETSQAANLPGVFAGGDIVTGGATVILAMGAGRRAAAGILEYIAHKSVWPPAVEVAATAGKSAKKKARKKREAKACPKCHQPIEGDEESYVCCAGATLRWHCTDCHKVSEGFAFPYGLCPACGGALSAEEREVDTDSKESQQAIRVAFQIELGGRAFYRRGAAAVRDAKLKDLFSRLAEMEEGHMRTLSRRYHVAPSSSEGLEIDQVAVYAGVEAPGEDGDALLRLAIELERRARDFFAEQRDMLAEDSPAWRLYRELEAEEREHVDMLTSELARFSQDKPGLL